MAVAAMALSGAALAGFQTGQAVVIYDAGNFANADVGYVHNTASTTEYIGCTTAGNFGYCFAQNRDGLYRSCSSSDPQWVTTMRTITQDTYLFFQWDASGRCIYVSVQNSSTTAPKK